MSTIDDIDFKIARLELKPGDILVLKLRVGDRFPIDASRRLQEHIVRATRGQNKCLVLENGADLAVLTAAEIEARSTAPTSDEAAV